MNGDGREWSCYMVKCRDGALYVGIASDVLARVKRHNWGVGPEFTARRRPVELVWSEPCGSADAARRREKEIKGWSRVRKLALIQESARRKASGFSSTAEIAERESRVNPSPCGAGLRVKGSRFNGRPPVSKTGCGGSNPSSPASFGEQETK